MKTRTTANFQEKCDEWLSTRNKKKISKPSPIIRKHIASRTLSVSSGSKLWQTTQNSPPPSQLFTATKQSVLMSYFNRKNVSDIVDTSESHDIQQLYTDDGAELTNQISPEDGEIQPRHMGSIFQDKDNITIEKGNKDEGDCDRILSPEENTETHTHTESEISCDINKYSEDSFLFKTKIKLSPCEHLEENFIGQRILPRNENCLVTSKNNSPLCGSDLSEDIEFVSQSSKDVDGNSSIYIKPNLPCFDMNSNCPKRSFDMGDNNDIEFLYEPNSNVVNTMHFIHDTSFLSGCLRHQSKPLKIHENISTCSSETDNSDSSHSSDIVYSSQYSDKDLKKTAIRNIQKSNNNDRFRKQHCYTDIKNSAAKHKQNILKKFQKESKKENYQYSSDIEFFSMKSEFNSKSSNSQFDTAVSCDIIHSQSRPPIPFKNHTLNVDLTDINTVYSENNTLVFETDGECEGTSEIFYTSHSLEKQNIPIDCKMDKGGNSSKLVSRLLRKLPDTIKFTDSVNSSCDQTINTELDCVDSVETNVDCSSQFGTGRGWNVPFKNHTLNLDLTNVNSQETEDDSQSDTLVFEETEEINKIFDRTPQNLEKHYVHKHYRDNSSKIVNRRLLINLPDTIKFTDTDSCDDIVIKCCNPKKPT